MKMKIFIGADHAGFGLKEEIIQYFKKTKIYFKDFGTKSDTSVDYPDFAFAVADAVSKNKNSKGILICGTGTGMVIAANKVRGIRAALIYDDYSAEMSRKDNDINIACLRGRKFNKKKTLKILKLWLNTEFSDGERHNRRIEKIREYENKMHPVCLP